MDFYRARKQFIIALIFFLLVAGIVLGYWRLFVYQTPTCFDKIKNQGEEDVDCGAPCAPCVPFQDVTVIWAKVVPSGQNMFDLAAKINNPNPNFGTAALNYKFSVKDADGLLIGEKSGTTFILPNSTKYIIETNFSASRSIASVELTLEKVAKEDWQQLKDYEALNLTIKDKNFSVTNQPTYLAEAVGTVNNGTFLILDEVDINIVLYGENQQLLGVSRAQMRTLTPGENRFFSGKWFSPLAGDVENVDMQAETNVFMIQNYMSVHGVIQKY